MSNAGGGFLDDVAWFLELSSSVKVENSSNICSTAILPARPDLNLFENRGRVPFLLRDRRYGEDHEDGN